MKYLSIDIETTGLEPESCDVLQFAAVLDDLRDPKPVEALPRMEAIFLKRSGYSGHPFALSMHSSLFKRIDAAIKRNLETCSETGVRFMEIESLPQALHVFLLQNGFEPAQNGKIYVNVAGKNLGQFDLPFLNAKVADWGAVKFLSRVIDPAILYFDVERDSSMPDMKTCSQRAGLGDEVAHTATEDALLVVKLIRNKLLGERCAAEGEKREEGRTASARVDTGPKRSGKGKR